MTTFSQKLHEQLLDLAWSLWTGLGVPGQIDQHQNVAIDPEPLILFTAGLADADARLRDESTDWCIRYGGLISGTRLKNLLPKNNNNILAPYGELAATLAVHSSLRWPLATAARAHVLRERPKILAFTRPCQLLLRLRAVLGVGARADIVQVFLARKEQAFTAAQLAAETGYMKRTVAAAMETFRLGGLVQAMPIRNQIHYRVPLEGIEQLARQFSPMPEAFVRWSTVLSFLVEALALVRGVESRSETIMAVEAKAFVDARANELHMACLPIFQSETRGPGYWSEFRAWLLSIAHCLATGLEPAEDRFKTKWIRVLGSPLGEEVMERGGYRVFEDPRADESQRWVLAETSAQQTLELEVRYPTIADAKRSAERRQLARMIQSHRASM